MGVDCDRPRFKPPKRTLTITGLTQEELEEGWYKKVDQIGTIEPDHITEAVETA